MNRVRKKSHSYRRQSGIATILTIVLIGLAMTALAFQYMGSVRGTQEKYLASHAITHAHNGLWSGVEAFRLYLDTLTNEQVLALAAGGPLPITLPAGFGAMNVNNIIVTELGANKLKVEAELVNVHADAQSAAGLSLVYLIDPEACEDCAPRAASLDFNDDLTVNGGIVFNMPDGGLPVINVNGNITVDSVNISPLGRLNSTKNIHLGSSVVANEVYANGDVTITGGALVDRVWALGNVSTDGGAIVRNIWANGNVTSNASGHAENVNNRGSVSLTSGSYDFVRTAGTATVDTSGTIDEIQAVGDIGITTWGRINTLLGKGDLKCVAENFEDFISFKVTGAATTCPATTVTGEAIDIVIMDELKPFSAPEVMVDVWLLKPYANYIFEYDSTVQKTKVTVHHIPGIENGTSYYVGDHIDGDENSHLCKVFGGKKGAECIELTEPNVAMCLGTSRRNACLSYDNRKGGWILNGTSAAPGIMWFEGNVELSGGLNYTTILATGNVITAGALKSYAANYAGYEEVCAARGTGVDVELIDAYKAFFTKQAPANLCAGGQYSPIDVGNIAIAAGGYSPTANGQYSGGNITLGSLNEVFGSILSGNIFRTGGDTTVHGYISAAVQGSVTADRNLLSGATTINLMDLPASYDPGRIPVMAGPCEENCVSIGSEKKSTLLWSKYL